MINVSKFEIFRTMLKIKLSVIGICLVYMANAQEVLVFEKFTTKNSPTAPDYSLPSSWAALPFLKDNADTTAGLGTLKDHQKDALADVFFIHPTSFIAAPKDKYQWNCDISNLEINKKTDEGSILYQASTFNSSGKIYAPRYRQAHYSSYTTLDTLSAKQAFDLAYSDVRRSFEYYLSHFNEGRPIIIASHSQGTTHAIRLLKEYFDDKALSKQLICAYIIGMPVFDSLYSQLKPCESAMSTGCYCSWQTFAKGYYPKNYKKPKKYSVCTNPLTWTTDGSYASAKLNLGGTLRDFRKILPKLCDAQIQDGVLRINKPNIKGKLFLHINNYHIGDYNLFYMNIRTNAELRVKTFIENSSHTFQK
jgi:hypothetical protein